MTTNEPLPAYKVRQAATLMGVHPNTVYRMIRGGRLKTVRTGHGRSHRIPATEIAPYIDGQAV